ncbi:hypothetical protein Tco_0990696 [Tanacetum coccineum]|uniref:Uncharacterized protein n=1 Tax=Tanacetum coccineum TaxID=301880 RepID=A0ABQ5EYK0_9ASTR
MQVKETEKKNEAGKEEMTEVPSSQPVEYYLKHSINKKLIEGLVDNLRFNDSLSGARVVKIKGKTYNLSPRGRKETFHPRNTIPNNGQGRNKFYKGTITLRSGKSKISFHRIPESLCKIEREVKNDIDPISPTMTVNRLVLEWEERIKLHLEREMKFDQWKSKNFKSKHPALVKVEGEMDDEGEVT